jgi:hypothetical protein
LSDPYFVVGKEAVRKIYFGGCPLSFMLIFDILPEVFVSYAATLLNLFFGLAQEDLELERKLG